MTFIVRLLAKFRPLFRTQGKQDIYQTLAALLETYASKISTYGPKESGIEVAGASDKELRLQQARHLFEQALREVKAEFLDRELSSVHKGHNGKP